MKLVDFLLGYRSKQQWNLDLTRPKQGTQDKLMISRFQHKKSSVHLFHLRKEELCAKVAATPVQITEANMSANC